jgi:hypothetical protein
MITHMSFGWRRIPPMLSLFHIFGLGYLWSLHCLWEMLTLPWFNYVNLSELILHFKTPDGQFYWNCDKLIWDWEVNEFGWGSRGQTRLESTLLPILYPEVENHQAWTRTKICQAMCIYLPMGKSKYTVVGYRSSFFEYPNWLLDMACLLGNVYAAYSLFFPPTQPGLICQSQVDKRDTGYRQDSYTLRTY